jgi:Carboxypeptidase regulatory-like domain
MKTRVLFSFMLLSITAGVAFGQTAAGTLTGVVTDPSGAVIANAMVVATHGATGARIEGATSETGNYTIPQMPVGTYVVTFEQPGFKTFRATNVVIDAAQTVRLDVKMELGAATDSVTVTGDATVLQTDTGAIVRDILTKQIQDLPVLPLGTFVRDPLALAYTLPGTVNQFGSGYGARVDGLPVASNQYRVDGEIVTNSGFNTLTTRTNVSPDAIQEVAIQSSNFNAEFGSVSGAVFNQVIKSGTNQYHGTAYDYLTNDFLNAADAASHVKNRVRGNDYGINVGGPVRIPWLYNGKDKTFFFANFEQYLQYLLNTNDFTPPTVPTAAYRSGDFSGLIAASGNVNLQINGHTYHDPLGNTIPLGTIFNPTTTQTVACNTALSQDCGANGNLVTYRLPFSGNKIPLSMIDRVSAAILNKYVPLPQGPNAAAGILTSNYFNPFRSSRITRSPTLKIDQNIGAKARLSFTYSDNHTESPVQALGLGEGFPEPITGNGGTFENSPTFRLNLDYTLRPTMILHVGIGWQEYNFCNCAVTTNYNAATDIGLTGATLNQTFPRMNSTVVSTPQIGGLNVLGPPPQSSLPERHPTTSASLTWVHGNHTFKFGGDYRVDQQVTISTANTSGTYTFGSATAGLQTGNGVTWQPALNGLTGFTGNTNVGFPFANWLLGSVTSLTLSQPADYRQSKSQTGVYAQDTWRVRRNLTIDIGIRWDYGTYPKEQFGRTVDFSPTTPNPNADGRLGAYIYEATCKCTFAKNYPYAYAPRFGFAYTLDRKTVFRGGAGLAYGFTAPSAGRIINSVVTPTLQNGFDSFQLQNGIPASYQPVWPNYNPGYGFVPNTVNTLQASLIDPNAGRPDRTWQWNLTLQREIRKDLVVEAAYIANRNVWQATAGFQDINAVSVATLNHYGFTVGNLSDATLLNTLWSNLTAAQLATLAARGVTPPYPSFPTSGPFAATVLQGLKPFPQFSSVIAPTAPQGKSWYDSVQLQMNKRLAYGLLANVNYTYSKNLQYISSPDVFNTSVGKDLVAANPPQVFRVTFSYETPHPKGIPVLGNKYVSQVVGGWQLAAALYYQTGAYMGRPTSGSNNAISRWLGRGPGSAELKKNPDGSYMNPWSVDWYDLSGNHHTDPLNINCRCFDPTKTVVLNPNAWQQIPDATWTDDTSTYGFFRAPRRPNESANLAKNFRIKERYTFQIRMEFQNIFNRAFLPAPLIAYSPVNPLTTLQKAANGTYIGGFGTFGNLTNSGALGAQRTGQLIARFTF